MDAVINLITNSYVLVAVGSFLCGVALMSLVMGRTQEHRRKTAGKKTA